MSLSLFDLSGETALITGAAGGIGAELVRGLAAEGASVALADIDGARLPAVARDIAELGRQCVILEVDLTEPTACEEMVRRAAEELGRVSILVNSAGTNVRGTLDDIDEVSWDRVLDLNLEGNVLRIPQRRERDEEAGEKARWSTSRP